MELRLLTPSPPVPVGRLAPTPSGHLHLGNTLAFAAAWLSARSAGGRVLLRIEDVDQGRARDGIARAQRADLEWLGLHWDEEVSPQRDRDYLPWLERLAGAVYFCQCTRQLVRRHGGHPTACRTAGHRSGAVRFLLPPGPVTFVDQRWGPRSVDPHALGDPVLRRRDGVFSYSLAVVVDDLTDGVTEVVRGGDLLEVTGVQVRLWEALEATPPRWMHAPLVLGPDGRKLSKSHGSTEIRALRERGWSARDVWRVVLPWLGLDHDTPSEAIPAFDPRAGPLGPIQLHDEPGAPGRADWAVVRGEPAPG